MIFITGTALNIRGDNGTENSNVAAIQRLFRSNDNDPLAAEKSFRFGRSITNQVSSFNHLDTYT